MSLRASERSALLRGEYPSLTRPVVVGEAPPFSQGEEIVLKRVSGVPQVWLTILVVKRTRKGSWRVEYGFRDDRALYLRHNGNLTRSASESCDPEAPVIDPETQQAFDARGRLTAAERREDRLEGREGSELAVAERRKRERAIRDRLRETLDGLDPDAAIALLARVEGEIRSAQNAVGLAVAA